MVLAVTVSVLLAIILLWALYNEQVPPEEPRPVLPAWESLPTAADIAHPDLPLSVLGYDRAVVDAHLERVAAAYDTVMQARAQMSGPPATDGDEAGSSAPPLPPPSAG